MKHQRSMVDILTNKKSRVDHKYEKFTWKVVEFSGFKNTMKLCSKPFILGGYGWRIIMSSEGNTDVDCLSLYLQVMQYCNISKGWSRSVKLKFAVHNQLDDNKTITKETFHKLDEKENNWGFTDFMSLAELRDPQKGFVVKDVCIISVEVSVLEAINEKQVSLAAGLTAPLTSGSQTGHTEVEDPKPRPEIQGCNLKTLSPVSIDPTKHTDVELFSASIGELIDFKNLGKVEKAFVPLLKEVCTHHPSLIECQLEKTREFTVWAFNALGRVLYFLKTKKVKDMNDQCCKDLQAFWEELKIFGFDLTWLDPHVQSALGMKSYVEKVIEVEKVKENVVDLKLEMEKLNAKLVAAEANLELETKKLDAEKDLLKAKGFQVNDLEAELGYGNWEAKRI